jgi:Cysteine-rich secretory protein family
MTASLPWGRWRFAALAIAVACVGCTDSASKPQTPPVPAENRKPVQPRLPRRPSSAKDGVGTAIAQKGPEGVCDRLASVGVSIHTVSVMTDAAPVYIYPKVWVEPLATLRAGESHSVREVSGEWLLINFRDQRFGDRVGYIHCSCVDVPASAEAAGGSPQSPSDTITPPSTAVPQSSGVPGRMNTPTTATPGSSNILSSSSPSSPTGATAADLAFCVQDINAFRATVGRPPLAQSAALEAFAAQSAQQDATTGVPHSHFDATNGGGIAAGENELLPTALSLFGTVQGAMHGADTISFAEGPSGGHYQLLVGSSTQVGCGVFISNGRITVVQDFR